MGFIKKFLNRKGVSLGKGGITRTTHSSQSWSQTLEPGQSPDNVLPPGVAELMNNLPQGGASETAADAFSAQSTTSSWRTGKQRLGSADLLSSQLNELLNNLSPEAGLGATAGDGIGLPAFSMRALRCVMAVDDARSAGDPNRAAGFVTAEFLKHWTVPSDWAPAKSRSNQLTVISRTNDSIGERVVARVTSTADGRTSSHLWTFTRGPQTPQGGATQIRCPGCGAPFPDLNAGTCAYCGATVAPGPLDWMVERIDTG